MGIYRTLPILLLVVVLPRMSAAQSFGKALTADQVACEERQLSRLLYRTVAGAVDSQVFLWRSSPAGGAFSGLSVAGPLVDIVTGLLSHREEQLAFDLILKTQEDFLNPQRQLLPQATLVRRDTASNLSSAPPVPDNTLNVIIDLALEVPNPTAPTHPLMITNRRTPGAGQDDEASRGLAIADLLTACHTEVSDFDLRVFSLLSRTVRASDALLEPSPRCLGPFSCASFKGIIFRGAEPLTYRMNIHDYGFSCVNDDCFYGEGGVALLFRLQVDGGGRLTGGDVQVLPWCEAGERFGCTDAQNPDFGVFVLPPLRPGVETQGESAFLRAAHLNIWFNGAGEDNVLHDTVNWPDLLRDTSWNEGFTTSSGRTPGERR
jgi:hypothetical protein